MILSNYILKLGPNTLTDRYWPILGILHLRLEILIYHFFFFVVYSEDRMQHRRHYQGSHQDQYSGEKKNRPMFGSPRKSGVAAPLKGPIELITNNFRIRSRNHGIIYTYRVDFIEGHAAMNESQSNPGVTGNLSDDQASNVSRGSLGALETFQKYKIINSHT